MAQIRHNVILSLIDEAQNKPESTRQLLELLAREDMAISDEVFAKTLHLTGGRIGFVKITRPAITKQLIPPQRMGWTPRALVVFGIQWFEYKVSKTVLNLLSKTLTFETETRAFIVADALDQS